jgi:imidazolonepropionase-like amidohydrolase
MVDQLMTILRFLPLLLLSTAAARPPTPAPDTVVIAHVDVIDTATGNILRDRSVVVRKGRIAAIEKPGRPPAGAVVIDGKDKYLIPGLWDMHVHLSWSKESALRALLANGVIGVRDLGGDLKEIDDWRARIAAGVLPGPRIFRAGPILNGQKSNQYHLVTGGPAETRGIVRALKQVGVDFVKTHRRTEKESFLAMVDEAKKQGLDVVGHIPMAVTPEEACNAGMASIEHTETLFEGTFSAGMEESDVPEAIRQFREGPARELFECFRRRGTFFDPTLVAYRSILTIGNASGSPDIRNRYVARSFLEAQRQAKPLTPEDLDLTKKVFEELKGVVKMLDETGIPLLAGSDLAAARVPGFYLHDELALLVESGVTPLHALQAATLHPAEILKRTDDYGTVAVGRVADLVLLDANPLEDITNTTRISAVIRGGKVLRRADLDRLLKEAEDFANRN